MFQPTLQLRHYHFFRPYPTHDGITGMGLDKNPSAVRQHRFSYDT